MESIVYVLKMGYYLLFAIIMYALALRSNIGTLVGDYTDTAARKKGMILIKRKRIAIVGIIVLCVMVGYYGTICGQIPIGSDRGNYAVRFSSGVFLENVRRDSIGLYIIEKFLHMFTYDPYVLFFAIPFITLLLYLTAYNNWKDVTPFAILMLGISPCVEYGFYQFKQAPSVGFMAMSFAYHFRGKKLKSMAFLILAIICHESAWMMVPLYIVMRGSEKRWVRALEIGVLTVCMISFKYVSSYAVRLFTTIPGMYLQLRGYLDDTGQMETSLNIMTIIKGFPYYLITAIGFAHRKQLKSKIACYDQYLTMAVYASGCTLLSAYMYWMWRFGSYTYFPIFVFAGLMLREMGENSWAFKYTLVISMAFLTFRGFAQVYFLYGGY